MMRVEKYLEGLLFGLICFLGASQAYHRDGGSGLRKSQSWRMQRLVNTRSIFQSSYPVNVSDLDCLVCDQEDDISCKEDNTPQTFAKHCSDLIPPTSDSFGNQPEERRSYLCYKKYDPYTKAISRSCQTSFSLPEWLGVSGCTASRHTGASGKVGSRCICNTTNCNGGNIYIPMNSSKESCHLMKISTIIVAIITCVFSKCKINIFTCKL